jgi:hypothetical protein
MTWIHQSEDKSCNFVAPAGLAADQEVLFPAADVQTPEAAATLPVTIKQMVTFIHLATAMAAAMTINLSINAQVTKGAIIHLKAASDGTARDITFGTGFTAPVLAGVISKTKVQSFIYNGTAFFPIGDGLQID